ncbi:hypothetical protein CDEF62S_03819 [Castellaniella defragrans]
MREMQSGMSPKRNGVLDLPDLACIEAIYVSTSETPTKKTRGTHEMLI